MHTERPFEELLLRIAPQFATQWAGASAQEIDDIERRAGRPLPDFYRWFLATMGANTGPMEATAIDLRAQTVLSVTLPPEAHERFVPIGIQKGDMTSYHCYDLAHPNRGDARVVVLDDEGEFESNSSETLRELIAFMMLQRWRVTPASQQCTGWLTVDGPHVSSHLTPVMHSLGYTTPIPTGPCCSLFEKGDTTLLSRTRDLSAPLGVEFFEIGGPDVGTIQQILDRVAAASRVKVKINAWGPELP